MIIYIDVYFLINFCIDYIALHLTCTFFQTKTNTLRLTVSSLLGGLISILLFFLDLTLLSLCLLPASSYFMCRYVVGKPCIWQWLTFLGVGFLTGGFLTSVQSILKNGYSTPAMLMPTLALCVAVCRVFKNVQQKIRKNCLTDSVEAEIRFGNFKTQVNLLIDSGNLAIEPMTGKRIIILGNRISKKISIPETAKKYSVNLKSATGNSVRFAYVPDEIIFSLPNASAEEFLILINPACDDFAGYDGLSPIIKMR